MKKTILLGSAVAALAAWVIGGVARNSGPSTQQGHFDFSINYEQVPVDVAFGDAVRDLRYGKQKGMIKCWPDDQRVSIRWLAGGLVNSPKPVGYVPPLIGTFNPNPISYRLQDIPTRFFPMQATVVGDDGVLVGGVTTRQEVVIELWKFEYPSPMPFPFTNTTTGVTTVQAVAPTRSSISNLYRSGQNSVDFVRAMCALRKDGEPSTHGIVLFDESATVVQLKLSDGTQEVVAGPVVAGQLPAISELASVRYNRIVPAERQVEGYVYRMCYKGIRGIEPAWPLLVLVDADKDGAIDGHVLLDEAAYNGGGWADASTYVDLWLE